MDEPEIIVQAAVNLANQEFIKGFIFGQIILAILIFALLKVFLFRGSAETRLEMAHRRVRLKVSVVGYLTLKDSDFEKNAGSIHSQKTPI